MDLVYVPEILTYGYFRAPQYRDYEQPWNKDYFNCGTSQSYENESLFIYSHMTTSLLKRKEGKKR